MNDHGVEITYEVQYQRYGSADWFTFTNHRYERPAPHTLGETSHLPDALEAAHELMEGVQHTHERPEYRHAVRATRVVQRVAMGTALFTLGEPESGD